MFFKAGSKAHLDGSLDSFCMLIYGAAPSVRALAACKGRPRSDAEKENTK